MGKWTRRIGIGLGVICVLLIAGAAWLWHAKPWIPPVELAAPGPGGKRIAEAGLIGNFYTGSGTGPRPAILLLGGSEGGLGSALDGEARLLAREGFAVLALAYYRLPGQAQRFELIPLETFTRALDWLKQREGVDPRRVAIMGTSKGAEAALLVASRREDLRAVVAAAPSHLVWQGFDWSFAPVETSSWSEGGEPVAYLAITNVGWDGDIYGPSLAHAPEHPEAAIPLERIAAPVLLLCGEADSLWPACPMARAARQRRNASGRALVTTLLTYPDAGHLGVGPPLPDDEDAPWMLTLFGGTAQGNLAARADGWPRTIAFLKAALASPRTDELADNR